MFFCKINFSFYFLEKTLGLILIFALGHITCWAGPDKKSNETEENQTI
jgi:hypothetical protein